LIWRLRVELELLRGDVRSFAAWLSKRRRARRVARRVKHGLHECAVRREADR
jgi:hypothetical protein